MPTKVPKPDQTPTSISPTHWQNVNRRDILSFLDDHSGSYLFYKVMGNDPDPDNSSDEEYNAISVDEIFAMQKAQYIAQAASMHLLVSMGQTNYSATISGVAPNTPDCGTKLLSL